MNKLERINAKIEFCSNILEYKKCFESNYQLINKINDTLKLFKGLGVLEEINVERADAIIHNKLSSTLKEFIDNDMDPIFFYDQDSNEYFPGNFYIRYILSYLSSMVLEIHQNLDSLINGILVLTLDVKKLNKHVLKEIIVSIMGGNMILEDKKCLEDIDVILKEYKKYKDKLDELYVFNIKKDYLKIVEMRLELIFKEKNREKLDFESAINLHYNIDVDYLTKIGRAEDIVYLREIYIKHLQAFNMSFDILDRDSEPYFASILPETEEVLEYTKLSSQELSQVLLKLFCERLELLSSGVPTGDAPRDIAQCMVLSNEMDKIREQGKK